MRHRQATSPSSPLRSGGRPCSARSGEAPSRVGLEPAELHSAAQWNLHTLPDRLATLKADPWADYPRTRQSVTADMRRRIGLG
uniref:Uncharacterized protein n=1 Tax=Ralstonia solanacearum TaxID=305 RepID=A0A809E9P1_RALSL